MSAPPDQFRYDSLCDNSSRTAAVDAIAPLGNFTYDTGPVADQASTTCPATRSEPKQEFRFCYDTSAMTHLTVVYDPHPPCTSLYDRVEALLNFTYDPGVDYDSGADADQPIIVFARKSSDL
jgi:hypothetical protein